ncbi:MAG: hypothetical protein IIC52_05980, partial [Proteobacteria bacterium]|nr:hypothetical protein [Pseudomonadota bacterium]
FKVRTFTFKGRRMENHNRLLDRYAGADGIKTGFIQASGFNLAASAERDGIRLIAVVLGARSPRARDLHTMGLLERGFEKATQGRHHAYQYDRNIRVTRKPSRINQRIRVHRAPGARGRIRLSRLTPPRRSASLSLGEQGSAAGQPRGARSSQGWAVRIGTFSRASFAKLALVQARRRLPHLLAGARHRIRPVVALGKTLFRAEFLGLKRASAQSICAWLEARGQSCLALGTTPAAAR